MEFIRRHFLQLAGSAIAGPLFPCASRAETYPGRPVRVIVPVSPGGANDTTARLFAQGLSEHLGQQFYVENQVGAGGNIGMGFVARAAADGYTVLGAGGNFVINPSLYAKVPYDPRKDFAPVSLLCSSPHVLAVHPSVPANSVKEFIALAKANPDKYSYASAGRGTPAHLGGELFKLAFGLDITHVPFGGGGPGINATIGGHVPVSVSALPTALPFVKAGTVRGLAMMSAKRTALLPDVPTMAEATGTNLEAIIVSGFVVPAATPKEIIDILHRGVVAAIEKPGFQDRLATLGFDSVASTPEAFADWISTELAKWNTVIRDAHITLQ